MIAEKIDREALKRKLRAQWNSLWWERFDDEVRAEGVAIDDYPDLFVDKGTIIIATKDYKPLSFTEIWEKHLKNLGVSPQPHPSVGGIGKFIRDYIKKPGKTETE
jgi:hypothetical protein